jgi:hypothetical protein
VGVQALPSVAGFVSFASVSTFVCDTGCLVGISPHCLECIDVEVVSYFDVVLKLVVIVVEFASV